jgi:eukaryotic-like serine/threonine-protein kinase
MSSQQVFSDRYEMVNHIARGGMAQVYLARDLLLDRLVALKVLFPELSVDRAFVERFRREAKAAANLTHPNIVSIYDWGQGERTYFIVMEYVDGHTLSSMLRDGAIEPTHAAAIGADVAAALEFAHRHGVIHRDVKPGNVLINTSGQVKVADFGIARAVGAGASEDLTQTGSVMGTATYFSPEQAQGFPVDARSDVYSLGVVLYEMVTGKPPFSGDSPVSIAYKHVKEQPAFPSTVNPAVAPGFEAIVLKAMAKEPDARYQSAEDLRSDLVRFGQGQPVAALVEPTRVAMTVGSAAATAALGGVAATRVQEATRPPTVPPTRRTAPAGGGPPEERRSRARLLSVLLIGLLVVLGVLLFFIGRSLGWWDSTKTLTVPTDVIGKPVAAATAQLHQDGFSHVSSQPQASSQYGAGDVITTRPRPGSSQKSTTPIVLVVSSGPSPVKVPNVIGRSQTAATAVLDRDGFVVNVTTATSNTVTDGNVISTNPSAGTLRAPGSAVQLVVSTGKETVSIPPLVGQTPSAAGQALGAAGLTVGSQINQPSSTVQFGLVIQTSPPAGTAVPVGSSVTVYVSTGPPQVTVPNLAQDTQAEANTALAALGLVGQYTTQPVASPSQNNIVVSQSPPANTAVNKGSTVNVVIGAYSAPTTTSSSSSPATAPSSSSSSSSSTTSTSVPPTS